MPRARRPAPPDEALPEPRVHSEGFRQTRAAHLEIETLIERVEQGDPPLPRGGGSGGGGFGGGLFSGPVSDD